MEQELRPQGRKLGRHSRQRALEMRPRLVIPPGFREGPAEVENRDIALGLRVGGVPPQRDRILPDADLRNGQRRERDEPRYGRRRHASGKGRRYSPVARGRARPCDGGANQDRRSHRGRIRESVGGNLCAAVEQSQHGQEEGDVADPCREARGPATTQGDRQRGDADHGQRRDEIRRAPWHDRVEERVERRQRPRRHQSR